MSGSVVMRTGSDQLLYEGSTKHMVEEGKKLGAGVLDQDGTAYIPLKAAMTALGGKAEDDGKGAWNVTCGESTATVDADDGKTKVDGKRASGDGFSTYTDQDKNRFYVSPQVLAAILGKTYTDLGDGVFSFTGVTLDGFDSQKAYLKNMKDKLGDAVDGDIPEADVYIALTFDDGPTGKKDGYPNGLTNYLLDGLKQRGAVATFLMVGERVSEVSDVLPRMVNEGHELGNHTMNHPMCHLTGLGVDDIRTQIDDATNAIKDIAGQAPQVLRPVGGGVNSDVKAVAAELGYPIINWSVDTEDWKYRDADHVKKVIVEQAQDVNAVHVRQTEIEDDQIRTVRGDHGLRLAARAGQQRFVVVGVQNSGDKVRNALFVLHDEYFFSNVHCSSGSFSIIGRRKMNSAPPSLFCACIVPPCARTMALHTESPSPILRLPSPVGVSLWRSVPLNSMGSSLGGMPPPLSCTAKTAFSPS